MTLVERIAEETRTMSVQTQQQVLDFVQFLKQRDIHLRIIIPQADYIALRRRLSDHFDGQQDDWGITGLGAALILKPPQHTQSKV